MNVFIVTNSPGELSGWVRPVIRSLKKKKQDVEIILIIPPCQYASGREVNVAKDFPGVKQILKPGDYIKYTFLGKSLPSISKLKGKKGVCVFLGGDPFHAVAFSKKLKLPAVAYMQKPRWRRQFEKFMVLNEEIKNKNFLGRGINPDKVIVVGDLIIDSVKFRIEDEKEKTPQHFSSEKPIISIIPGSRLQIAQNMTLFFLKGCELIKKSFPPARFFLILSSFLNKEEFFNFDRAKVYEILDVPRVKVLNGKGQWELATSTGLKVSVVTEKRYSIMSLSDLALIIPGTSTAEVACLGVPMLVVLPLQRPEMIPLDGLAGQVGKIPYLGVMVKRYIIKKYNQRINFCALPNIRTGKEIVPEMRGKIEPQDVANKAIGLLQDKEKLASISRELKKMMGREGASNKVAEVILQTGEEGN